MPDDVVIGHETVSAPMVPILITVPDHGFNLLAANAAFHGISVEQYVEQIVIDFLIGRIGLN